MRLPGFRSTAGNTPQGELFRRFRRILDGNNRLLEKMAVMERALGGEYVFDRAFLERSVTELTGGVREVISTLDAIAPERYRSLYDRFTTIADHLHDLVAGGPGPLGDRLVLGYHRLNRDLDHLAGGKNANLGEIGGRLGLAVPTGFAVTVAGYRRFMEANDLFRRIGAVLAGQDATSDKENTISRLFEEALLPEDLAGAIGRQLAAISRGAEGPLLFAVRSSAVGEDGSRSFAGQFESFLEVEASGVEMAIKRVLRSRFSTRLLDYLGAATGLEEVPMAVGVQRMVEAEVSGVVYSRDPNEPAAGGLLISAVEGHGQALVGGEQDGDRYTVDRRHPFTMMASRIKRRPPVNEKEQSATGLGRGSALLTPTFLTRLAEAGLLLEKSFETPVDIEWARTADGNLVILQCRPLRLVRPSVPLPAELDAELRRAPVLLADRGHVAQLGVASGQVVRVEPDRRPEDFPVGAVAVCRFASPQLAAIVRRAAALVTEVGSPTGHLATIAREYRTPALLGVGDTSEVLTEGREVTVDVEEKRLYAGRLSGLVALQACREEPLADEPEMRTLRRVLRLVAPLNLTDPVSPAFRPEGCRTFHDILRFCHEKAVEALIAAHSQPGVAGTADGPQLAADIPISLQLIDLGGGLDGDPARAGERKKVSVEAIRSLPFRALLAGLADKTVWDREPVPFGFRDLMSSFGRPLAALAGGPHYSGENLAILAENYCNLSLRLGYHFNVIDAYLAADPDDNYIYFRFVGGMAEEPKRLRRLELIARVLLSLQFRVERQGDLLVAKVKMLAPEHMEETLSRLGELIGFTRQLDVRMADDSAVERFFELFLARIRRGRPQETP